MVLIDVFAFSFDCKVSEVAKLSTDLEGSIFFVDMILVIGMYRMSSAFLVERDKDSLLFLFFMLTSLSFRWRKSESNGCTSFSDT